jgi:two-component system, LytTR family, sensor kinase
MQSTSTASSWRTLAIVSVFWTLMAVISAAQTYYFYVQMQESPAPTRVIYSAFSYSALWALATPLVFLMGRGFPVQKAAFLYNIPLHLGASIFLGLVHRSSWLWLQSVVPAMKPRNPIPLEKVTSDLIGSIDYQAMVYWVLLAVHQGTLYYRKYQQGRFVAAQLETQLAQAQLAGLKMQLQPHFLFNTLHSINALMYQNVGQASEMLVRLSEFLRASLDSSAAQEVTLGREVEFIQQYLDIERIRFEERLQVDYLLDESARVCLVPNMILQPLVENAIKHGISRLPAGGRIEIRAIRRNEELEIFVANSGPLLTSKQESSGGSSPGGIGLSNTKARLQTLYGDQQSFSLENWREGGVVAILRLPAHRAESQTAHPEGEVSPPSPSQWRVLHESTHS